MSDERVVELDLEFTPEAGVSGGLLIQSESSAFLLFNAMRSASSGGSRDGGVGLLEFHEVITTRFGYPNDEGREEHPLFSRGLAEIGYSVCEVLNSGWAKEWDAMTIASGNRIWGNRRMPIPDDAARRPPRHFLVAFHDSTFECVSHGFSFSIHERPWERVIAGLLERVIEE